MRFQKLTVALLLLPLSLVVAFAMLFAGAARANAGSTSSTLIYYPDPVFPMMEPLPFPWDNIEGIWQARVEGKIVLYSFEVLNDAGGRKFLHVLQLDPGTNAVVAEGRGFVDQRTNTVRAGMVSESGTAMLFLGLYRNDKLSKYPRIVTMLTTRGFRNSYDQYSVMIEKIVTQPARGPNR